MQRAYHEWRCYYQQFSEILFFQKQTKKTPQSTDWDIVTVKRSQELAEKNPALEII